MNHIKSIIMERLKLSLLILALMIITTRLSVAQQAASAAGGDLTGPGGNVSFTVGQVAWETLTSQNHTITQGVQQPYEIFITDVDDPGEDLETVVYPNPATDMINIRLSENISGNLSFMLLDMNGKELKNGSLTQKETAIHFGSFPSAPYLLLISENGKSLKSYKIIKQ